MLALCGFVVYVDCAALAVACSTTRYEVFCAVVAACVVLDEMIGLCGFVAASPVALWVAVKDCCAVCSVLLGGFSVACHECDATSALASLRLLSCVSESQVRVPPTFHSCVLLAAGLFRVEHQSPFVSLGNAAQ